MSRAIVPIRSLSSRLPEAGRIRTGVKSGKAMKAIDTFRFTSHDRDAIEQIAQAHGGTVQPWTDAPTPGQWQVLTQAREIPVVLPPDPLGGTPIYELWSGGGCARRCDGEQAEVSVASPEGGEYVTQPCICAAKNAMACKVKVRLNVILPHIKFGGSWRYETQSWNAAHEMPGMVGMLEALQDRGLPRGLLALEQRQSKAHGKTRNFNMVVLRVGSSPEAIEAGVGMGARSLGPAHQAPALGAGQSSEAGVTLEESPSSEGAMAGSIPAEDAPASEQRRDDGAVVDAEIVESEPWRAKGNREFHALLREHGIDEDGKHRIVAHYGVESSKDLTDKQLKGLIATLRREPDRVKAAAEPEPDGVTVPL